MSKPRLLRSKILPYHVTARANNRDPFFVPLDQAWDAALHRLAEVHLLFEARIHAFVLMPNHLHLLVTVPNEDLGIVMGRFIQNLTRDLNVRAARSGRVFGGPYHWSMIQSDQYFLAAYKYIYRNPVSSGIVQRVEDYPYSTLRQILGGERPTFRVDGPLWPIPRDFSPAEDARTLDWLNEDFSEKAKEAIRKVIFRPRVNRGLSSITHARA